MNNAQTNLFFSCHSENFGKLSAEETFSLIHSLGFTHIDVASRSLMPQAAILDDWQGCAASIKELSLRHSLLLSELFLSAVEVDGVPLSPAQAEAVENNSLFENFEAICRFAREAGFQSIMGATGSVIETLGGEASFENAASVLRRQVAIAREYHLSFHVEPSRTSLLHTPQKALSMIHRVPGLRYTLDFLHFHVQGIPLSKALELIPFAGHMHARQAAFPTGKCDFASGGIDYDRIVSAMAVYGWSGTIAMEFWNGERENAEGIDPVEQNIVMRYTLKKLAEKYGLI